MLLHLKSTICKAMFLVFLVALIPFASAPFAFASQISLVVNGQTVQCSQAPQIINGRTFVPLRDLDDALGAQTTWDGKAQIITVSSSVYNISMTIGSTTLDVNGTPQQMDVAPVIIGSRTFLPARYVAQALGYGVSWDATSQSVIITSDSTSSQNIQGMIVQDVKEGTGKTAEDGDQVTVNYVGTFPDGTVFDSSIARNQPFSFALGVGQVIEGWDLGVVGMKVGGERKLIIPAALGYGDAGVGPIPPNATLDFTIDLLSIN
jgi:hypothetical protein